jgi:hypothetical protein
MYNILYISKGSLFVMLYFYKVTFEDKGIIRKVAHCQALAQFW